MDLVTQQLHERRQRILETARQLIGECGYQALTMRELAARCRVSVPTLYNQFGSKSELLASAVLSHFSGLLGSGGTRHESSGHAHLVEVARLCSSEMTRLPDYHRALLGAFMELRDTARTQAVLTADLAGEISLALTEMRSAGELAQWADPAVLAQQITRAVVASSVSWLLRDLDDEGLQAAMVHTTCCMALGAARGPAKRALEREAAAAQAVLARQLGDSPNEPALPASVREA